MAIMKIEFTVFGLTLNLWDTFLYTVFIDGVVWVIWKVILDD